MGQKHPKNESWNGSLNGACIWSRMDPQMDPRMGHKWTRNLIMAFRMGLKWFNTFRMGPEWAQNGSEWVHNGAGMGPKQPKVGLE